MKHIEPEPTLEQVLEVIDKDELANSPIKFPDHPYIAELKNFGRDEFAAAFVDLFATTGANFIVPPAAKQFILPFVGPVLEKGIFLITNLWDARNVYLSTPKKTRQPYGYYLKKGFQKGSENLFFDLSVHDPLYISSMGLGIHYAPQVHPTVISLCAYSGAIILACALKVGLNGIKFANKKRELRNAGFETEKYFESRFYIKNEMNPEELMQMYMTQFNVGNPFTAAYHDKYIQTKLPVYNGRSAKIRIRKRQRMPEEKDDLAWGNDKDWVSSLQVVFTKKRKDNSSLGQFRYYPVEKEKAYFMFRDGCPDSIDNMPSSDAKTIASKIQAPRRIYSHISFERTNAHNDELAICADKVESKRPFYVVELKVRKDTKLLKEAMRYLMQECPVVAVQTNRSKYDLIKSEK